MVYETAKGGLVSLSICGNTSPSSFTYVNERGLPFGRAGINGVDVAQEIILELAYGKRKARTSFVISMQDAENGLTLVTVRQSVSGLRIVNGGFKMLVDEKAGKLHMLVMHTIYGVEIGMDFAKPNYERLEQLLHKLNIKGELRIGGLMLCGDRTAYFVEVGKSALALVDMRGGVLGLYVFDEKAGVEVMNPRGCRVEWLTLPENGYETLPA